MVSEVQILMAKAGFTPSETRVAELVVKGMSNKEVADKLNVSEKTVKFHLGKIYKRLEIKSRTQLVVWTLKSKDFKE